MRLFSKTKPYFVITLLFLSFFIGIATSLHINAAESLNKRHIIGKPSPDFSLPDINDQTLSLKQWRGKVIVLNFWATWCLPCLKEIPLLNKFQKHYAIDGLQIVGIAIDNKIAIKKFIKKTPIHYPNLIGNVQVTLKFGNQAGLLPYTVIINQQGNVVEVASGMLTEKYLQRVIEKHL